MSIPRAAGNNGTAGGNGIWPDAGSNYTAHPLASPQGPIANRILPAATGVRQHLHEPNDHNTI